MPVQLTYPGVYLDEIAGGVNTITGVATSITAFIGRAAKGPTDQPITINSFADFERIFGGLWAGSNLGFAVRDFYLNGGSQAIIVRVYNTDTSASAALSKSEIQLPVNNGSPVILQGANEGAWGNSLVAIVDHNILTANYGLDISDFFNLTIKDTATGTVEKFNNLTIKNSPRRLENVLANQSQLVHVKGTVDPTTAIPDITAINAVGLPTNQTITAAGDGLAVTNTNILGNAVNKTGLYALEKTDLFNLLCIPPYSPTNDVDQTVIDAAINYCEYRRSFLIIDSPSNWQSKDAAKAGIANIGTASKNAAVFFPRMQQPNILHDNQIEEFAPCGMIAGTIARTDAQRGIWKAPAGSETGLSGISKLNVALTDAEIGELNPLGINCLRNLPAAGPVIWGARTRQGDDRLASEWKYIPVRRLALYVEESLYRGTQWVVFEPNDEPLWSQIRLTVGSFMNELFRQGAFQGSTPKETYFVKCDKETTTQANINAGIVNIIVGFAPLKPAEFVVIKIQQIAGQLQS